MVVYETMIDMIAQPPVMMKAPAPPSLRMASWQSHSRLRPQPINMKRCMLLGKFTGSEKCKSLGLRVEAKGFKVYLNNNTARNPFTFTS